MKTRELRVWSPQVVFQEVPNEVALAFTVSGCPLKCEGCHSQDTWSPCSGKPLSNIQFAQYLKQYHKLITCVLFFGGEWCSEQLIEKLKMAKTQGLKTCLYSGFEHLPKRITQHLDFLKTGPWLAQKGGLDNPNTNQRFIDLTSNTDLTYKFQQHNNNQQDFNYASA